MNLVFEKFVAKLLRNSLQEFTFDYQNDLHLTGDYLPINEYCRNKKRMIPDIIVRYCEKSIAIIDTKYKLDLSKGSISNADVYQMVAYCIGNESDKAILLYPELPHQDQFKERKERDHFVVLDKLKKETNDHRSVLISAREIQLFDGRGKILRKLTEHDANTIRGLLTSKILIEKTTST
jgi:5-methylcytosine-specific restriction endonuclease McrBC regulatory subunit McrC